MDSPLVEAEATMMMIAEDLMVDQEVVLEAEARAVVRVVVIQVVAAVPQMDEAEIVQLAGHLQIVQGMDEAVLQTVVAILHQEAAAVLQVMEEVAAKKVLLRADDICIKTKMENRASALFSYL